MTGSLALEKPDEQREEWKWPRSRRGEGIAKRFIMAINVGEAIVAYKGDSDRRGRME